MRFCKAALFLLLATVLAVPGGAARAAVVPADGLLNFAVMRDGEEIGSHVLTFKQVDDKIHVTIKTRIAVKMAFITVYRFEQDGHEVWHNGKLIAMETETNDDGTDHTLQVKADGSGGLRVVGDDKELRAPPDSIPASLWNPAFIRTKALMDSLVGKPLEIQVAADGVETVSVKGRPVQARHYTLSGEMPRELWYDENWVLIRMTLTGDDGSAVQYVLN